LDIELESDGNDIEAILKGNAAAVTRLGESQHVTPVNDPKAVKKTKESIESYKSLQGLCMFVCD
jgi:hypothetical protein